MRENLRREFTYHLTSKMNLLKRELQSSIDGHARSLQRQVGGIATQSRFTSPFFGGDNLPPSLQNQPTEPGYQEGAENPFTSSLFTSQQGPF